MEATSPYHFAPIPRVLTRLIGREALYQRIRVQLTTSRTRLVTLTGPGGIGKTRLACAVADTAAPHFRDGLCFVSLAAIRSPEHVIAALAQALRRETGSRPAFEIVQMFLRDRELLLVLDTMEHLIAAVPDLSTLLSTCPQLTILATSREALRCPWEQEIPIPALTTPDLPTQWNLETLAHNSAITLFLERAQAINPLIRLNETNAFVIAQICIELDGLPLALELAAALVKMFSLSALLARLSHRLSTLTIGRRDAPARQQTLRHTIQWSYDLLTPVEQQLFQRVCVFVGGTTLFAIEALYHELGISCSTLQEDLQSLIKKNLMRLEVSLQEEDTRLVLLETIREFGLECLASNGTLQQVQLAHLRYYTSWAQRASQGLFGLAQRHWLHQFIQEQGNWRAAAQFALATQDQEAAFLLGGYLGPFWFFWGSANRYTYMLEGKAFFQQALKPRPQQETRAYARALGLLGGILGTLRESERGIAYCQQALLLARKHLDLQLEIQVHWMLWQALFAFGDFRRARTTAEEAVALVRQHPEVCTEWDATWMLGYSLFHAGYIAVWDGRFSEARVLLEESMHLVSMAGDLFILLWATLLFCEAAVFEGKDEEATTMLTERLAWYEAGNVTILAAEALCLQGIIAWHTKNMPKAQVLLEESRRRSKETGDERRIAWTATWLARVALAQSQQDEAQTLLTEALIWAQRKQDRAMIILCLEGLGMVAASNHTWQGAVRLWGAAQLLRDQTGFPRMPVECPVYEAYCAAGQITLGEVRFQQHWKEGQNMSLHQVLSESCEEQECRPVEQKNQSPKPFLDLTPREAEVLSLLAQGLTNKEIATRLHLRITTINSHVRSIYNKLEVTSRTQAIRIAHDHLFFS